MKMLSSLPLESCVSSHCFISAWVGKDLRISDVNPLALDGGGPGRRAAAVGPKGEEEAVIAAVISAEFRRVGGFGEDLGGAASGVGGCEEALLESSE